MNLVISNNIIISHLDLYVNYYRAYFAAFLKVSLRFAYEAQSLLTHSSVLCYNTLEITKKRLPL